MEKKIIVDDQYGVYREGDLLVQDLLDQMTIHISLGHTVWVRFCCQECHARQQSDKENCFHVSGYSCEQCGEFTVPRLYGFAVQMGLTSTPK